MRISIHKKLTAAALAVCLTFGMMQPVCHAAKNENTFTYYETVEQGVLVEEEIPREYYLADTSTGAAVSTRVSGLYIEGYDHVHDADIVKAIDSLAGVNVKNDSLRVSVNVKGWGIKTTTAKDVVNYILDTHPELFYIAGITQSHYTDSTDVTYLHFQLNTTQLDNVGAQKKAYEDEISSVIAQIKKDSMSRVELALACHDYLVETVAYSSKNPTTGTYDREVYTAYGALVNKDAVCQGYSLAYMDIMNRCGVPCSLVVSENANHAWNLIYEDGYWYHIDTTWDDPAPDALGVVKHDYFMLSHDSLINMHADRSDYFVRQPIGIEYAFSEAAGPVTGGFWNNSRTFMSYYNGKWYYLGQGSTDAYFSIYERDFATGEVKVVHSAACRWPLGGSAGSEYFAGQHGKLLRQGSRLLFSTPSTIEYYDIADGTSGTVFTSDRTDKYIYGFGIKNGNLCYALRSNVNSNADEELFVLGEYVQDTPEKPEEEKPEETEPSKVIRIAFDKSRDACEIGTTKKLVLKLDVPEGLDSTVKWSSSDPATVSVSSSGRVKALKYGYARITATASDGSRSTCIVYAIKKIALSKTTLSAVKGKRYTLTASTKPVNAAKAGLVWSSSNTKVAKVNSSGKVTAVGEGKARITVRCGNMKASCVITVIDKSKTGLYKASNGNTYYYKKGEIVRAFTGIVVVGDTKWYVKKGKVMTDFTGKVTLGGRIYNIKKGKVR